MRGRLRISISLVQHLTSRVWWTAVSGCIPEPFRNPLDFALRSRHLDAFWHQSIYKLANIKTFGSSAPPQRKSGEIKWLTENKATKHRGGKGQIVPRCLTEEVRGGQQQSGVLYEHKLREEERAHQSSADSLSSPWCQGNLFTHLWSFLACNLYKKNNSSVLKSM